MAAFTSVFASLAVAQSEDRANLQFFGRKGVEAMSTSKDLPVDTDQIIIHLKAGANFSRLAARHGLARIGTLANDSSWVIVKVPFANRKAIVDILQKDSDVIAAGNNQLSAYKKMAFVPNDPFFPPVFGFAGQWHLLNQIATGTDANIVPAWNNNWTGNNIVIGIVDDDLQTTHPDLAPNYSAANSWDFGQNDPNPDPVYANDQHGTSVSGVAGARGGNGIGVSGAAPFAKLAGLRIDFPLQTTSMFVDATLYRSSGASEAIKVKNHSYGYSATFIPTQLEVNALATSAAKETIHCFAAGNARGTASQDSNTLHTQSSPDVIAVAALGANGKFASYSSFGSNVLVTAPSSTSGFPGIMTTDIVGANGYNPSSDTFPDQAYTSVFGGTSSATPLVTGIIALARQANSGLNLRLAKHMLVRTSKVVDPTDVSASGGWVTNAAGFKFNENYGFGCIDAAVLTNLVQQYQGVTNLVTEAEPTTAVAAAIPDNNPIGVTRTFGLASTKPLEEMLITLDITHPYRGDVEVWLTSPAGTLSRLKSRSSGDGASNISWTFESNAFWGENPSGTWTLVVRDMAAADLGTWNNFSALARMGSPVLKDNSTFVSQTIPTSMVAGQTYTGTVQYQNTGFSTWTNPLWYMRTENPSANTTFGFSQVNLLAADNIAPGGNKTFPVTIFAPTTGGVYNFQTRMRHSGSVSFGQLSTNTPINVTVMPDAARYVSTTAVPTSVPANTTFPVTITMRNVGTNTWNFGSLYQLKAITSATKWGNPYVALVSGDSIVQGANKSFTFTAVAPATPGTYVLQYQMALNTSAFGDKSRARTITVTP
ncbi:MAG: kexin [Fimbriimonadaceae bacterium]|nr:kexin [Fimbriimonadaceae bacterium]